MAPISTILKRNSDFKSVRYGLDPTYFHQLTAAETNTEALLTALRSQIGELPDHRIEAVEDKDWEREWMENFKPICFGEKLWIVPSWHEPPQPDAVNILLDPGLAFGTGTHPTTALCLQ